MDSLQNCANGKNKAEGVSVTVVKRKRKPLTVFGVQFVHLYILGIITAFIGWIAENTAKLITTGIIDSRFHLLPFISPYMLIPFAMHIVFKHPDDITVFGKKIFKQSTLKTKILSNVIVITTILVGVFLGEFAVGTLWEKAFGVKLWNYSNLPLQINQYAGLIPTLGYGLGAYLLFRFMYIPGLKLVQKIPHKVAFIICCTLGVLIPLDTLSMAIQIVVKGQAPVYWCVHLW